MKLKMTKTAPGSPDGKTVVKYEAGKEYCVNESLYNTFVNILKVAAPVIERRAIAEPLNNKMENPVVNNKEDVTPLKNRGDDTSVDIEPDKDKKKKKRGK